MMYDTMIIGNDMSSLVAAVTSAHAGRKTILLSNSDISDAHREAGYTFDIDPMPMAGFGEGQIFSRFLSERGITLVNETNILPLNPTLQIIFPDNRIELFNDKNEFMKDMEREFPHEGMGIRNFYTSLLKISDITEKWIKENPYIRPRRYKHVISHLRSIPEIIKGRWLLSGIRKMLRKNPVLKIIFETEFYLLSNLYRNGHFSFPLISPYMMSLPLRGVYDYVGGKDLLIRDLRQVFVECGGQIIRQGTVAGIIPGKEIDVTISGCEEISRINGKKLIVSTKSEAMDILLSSRKFKRMKNRFKRIEKRYYPFTLHMGVLDKGIPEKMARYVAIVVNKDGAIVDDNIVFVEISAPNDTRKAPLKKRALSATIFLKDSPGSLSNLELEEKSKTIIGHLEGFLPFLRENLDYLNVEASISLSRKYQEVVNQKYQMKADPFWGIAALSNRTPVKNIYLTGGMLLPGLGFEGEIISGINTANATIT
jgi:phytoene dehydrogenase-like protein